MTKLKFKEVWIDPIGYTMTVGQRKRRRKKLKKAKTEPPISKQEIKELSRAIWRLCKGSDERYKEKAAIAKNNGNLRLSKLRSVK